MTVTPLPLTRRSGSVRLSARFRYAGQRREEIIWFDVPEACERALCLGANAWALLGAVWAASLGEDLDVEGNLDSRLQTNLDPLIRTWCAWHPQLRPPVVRAKSWAAEPVPANGKCALFFTGGVDSFYSLLSYAQQPQISHLLYVEGFDIPLSKPGALARKRARLERTAQEYGVQLIILQTNLRQTRYRKLDWGLLGHGPALGAAGLLLGRGFDRILLSSSYGPLNLCTWGSHPQLDPLMSTSRTRFIHYGAEKDRFEKTSFIAASGRGLTDLHVCWREFSDQNCGVCEKCFRTQLALAITGALERATSFPPGAFTLDRLRKLAIGPILGKKVYPGLAEHAMNHGKPEIAAAIKECIARNDLAVNESGFWQTWRRRFARRKL